MEIETEEEIAIATAKENVIVIGVEEAVIETRGVLATLILRTLGASVGAIGAVRKMEEIIDTPLPNAIDQLAAMIAGRSLLEMIAGKTTEMTEWAAEDGATTEAAEAVEAKSTGRSPLPGMSDWSWSCLALAILGSILANMRISQLRLPERTYHHTSHL